MLTAIGVLRVRGFAETTVQLLGSSVGNAACCGRSLTSVGRPAASARSHDADVSPADGNRRHETISAAARYAGNSASATKPVTVTRSATPADRASDMTS